jgi:FkbM family methyltransferase
MEPMHRLRAGIRRGLALAFGLVPLGLLMLARRRYATSPDGSAAARVLRPILELARHRGIPTAEFRLPDHPEIRFGAADSLVLQRVFWMGERGWEPELLDVWREAAARAEQVVEIGANVGYFTIQAAIAAPSAQIRAVEPHPATAALLRQNVALNKLSNVEVVEAAATDVDGPVALSVPAVDHFAAPAGAYVADRSEIASELREGGLVVVEGVAATRLVDGVDLLKIDVEGMEHVILGSIASVLMERRPTILVELLDGTPHLRAILGTLAREADYEVLAPTRTGLVAVDAERLDDLSITGRFRVRDLMLRRRPDEAVPAAN